MLYALVKIPSFILRRSVLGLWQKFEFSKRTDKLTHTRICPWWIPTQVVRGTEIRRPGHSVNQDKIELLCQILSGTFLFIVIMLNCYNLAYTTMILPRYRRGICMCPKNESNREEMYVMCLCFISDVIMNTGSQRKLSIEGCDWE